MIRWTPYADRPYRDALACANCQRRKEPKLSPKGWWKRFTARVGHTVHRCPACGPGEEGAA